MHLVMGWHGEPPLNVSRCAFGWRGTRGLLKV